MAATDDKPISLASIGQTLRSRLWLVLGIFVLVMAGVVAGTLATPKQYETRMKVLVKNERADMIVTPDRTDTSGHRAEVSEAEINSEIEILTSNDLLQQVAVTSGLDRRQGTPNHAIALEQAVMRLQRDLKVSSIHKSNIILVEYSSTDPHMAVSVLANLADLYLEEHLKVHGTPGSYEFFKTQAARYQQQLENAESRLADLRRSENIVMPVQQKDVALQKSADAQTALNQADAEISEYTEKVIDTRNQIKTAAPRVLTQTRTASAQYSVEHLSTMLTELQNRRTQLLVKFQPDDRLVQEANQEIADTQAALEKAKKQTTEEQATDVNPVYQSLQIELAKEETELAGAQSRRVALARQSWIYHQQLVKLADASSAFEDLTRNQKEAEDNYILYTKKTEEARIAESLDKQKIANVAIAEAPVEPHLPSKPNKATNFALGAILATLLSLASAFAAEFMRNTVEDPAELEEITNLPVLACSHGD